MKRSRGQTLFIAAFLAPALLVYTAFVAVPGVRALLYSLQKYDGLTPPEWAGFQNFAALFHEGTPFRSALAHNLFIALAAGTCILTLALFFASVLHRRVRGAALFRIAFFFPNVIASVAVALLWILIYSTTDFGVLNGFLSLFADSLAAWGVNLPVPFTGKPYLVYATVPMIVWMATGFYMVLFLAAMEGIPETLYEAATIDGARPVSQFWHVTLPLIREVLVVGAVFLLINCFKLFEAIWIMDNEWPSKETHVLATLLYQKVFSEYNVGQGAAVAVLLFVIVFAATFAIMRLSRDEALEY